MTHPWQDRFETYARRLLDLYLCPGLAIGLAEGGELAYFKGFGQRDVERDLPMTPDTVMGIGSCTKSFTAAAIMQLQEAGRLSVHDPVVTYLPEFQTSDPAHTRAVTLHHLLTHTAGLPPLPTLLHALARSLKADPFTNTDGQLNELPEIRTAEEMLAFIAKTPFELLGPPGTRFSYSNDGFALLGAVVERVSGLPYDRYLRENILQPAGMTRTSMWNSELEGLDDVASLYSSRRQENGESVTLATPGFWECAPMEAGGQLRSTVRDMLRYCELYRTGGTVGGVRILSEAAVRAMTTPYVEYQNGLHYGYGLMVVPSYNGLSLIEHGGSIKGVSAMFSVVPGRQLTGVVLTNMAGVPAADILLTALNGALGLPPETRRTMTAPYSCTAEELALLEGQYPTTEGVPGLMTFWVEADRLMVKTEGGMEPMPPTELTPTGPARFQSKNKETVTPYRFHFDSQGQVWAVSVGLRMLRRSHSDAGLK